MTGCEPAIVQQERRELRRYDLAVTAVGWYGNEGKKWFI